MKMFNGEINKFAGFLLDEPVNRVQTRLRSRFLKLLQPRLDEMTKEMQELQEKYAVKDEHGEIKIDNGLITLTDGNKYNKEYNELQFEELVIDELESNRQILLAVKDMVINTKCNEFKGVEAIEYDRWCEIVGTIEYEEEEGAVQ